MAWVWAAALGLAFACNRTREESEPQATAGSAASNPNEPNNAYLRGVDQQLRELNTRIEELGAKVEQLGRGAAEKVTEPRTDEVLRSRVDALRQERDRIASGFKQLNAKSNEKLEEARKKIDEGLSTLGRDVDQALDDVGDEIRELTE